MWCASQTCWCQSSQVSWNFGMHGRHVKLVKAHWHECSIGTMPTYTQTFVIICSEHCFASRPVGEASILTHFLRPTKLASNWRDESYLTCNPRTTMKTTSPCHAGATNGASQIGCLGLIFHQVSRNACAVGVCSSSAQCEDDEASEKTDWRHGNCQHRAT